MSAPYAEVLYAILEQARLATSEADREPGRVVLVPGTAEVWDDCCEGQLYARVIDVFPTAPFPQFDTVQKGANLACSIKMMNLHIGLGLIRCAATVDDEGRAPTAAAVSANGEDMLADMALLLDVITCKVPSVKKILGVKLDRWTPKGVTGGCHGGEWGVHLAIDPCLEC